MYIFIYDVIYNKYHGERSFHINHFFLSNKKSNNSINSKNLTRQIFNICFCNIYGLMLKEKKSHIPISCFYFHDAYCCFVQKRQRRSASLQSDTSGCHQSVAGEHRHSNLHLRTDESRDVFGKQRDEGCAAESSRGMQLTREPL